jgi:hypothetical protein
VPWGQHPLLECGDIERCRLPAGFAFNQRCTYGLDLSAALLFPLDQVADVFAVVGVVSGVDLSLNPFVLLVRQRNCLAHGSHCDLLGRHQ